MKILVLSLTIITLCFGGLTLAQEFEEPIVTTESPIFFVPDTGLILYGITSLLCNPPGLDENGYANAHNYCSAVRIIEEQQDICEMTYHYQTCKNRADAQLASLRALCPNLHPSDCS